MTPERLAEIRAADALYPASLPDTPSRSTTRQRRDLLAYIAELEAERQEPAADAAAQPRLKSSPLVDRLAAEFHELNRQAVGRNPDGAKAFEPVLVYIADELHKHLDGFATDRQAGAVLLVAAVAAAHIARQYPTAPQAVVNVIAEAGERLYRGGGPALRKKK